ncbi:uncharacterized protein PV07_00367 [Cladophialophora immunda]|uniref:magnesium chelatase n=1 Tax=Cladophialophora immunda TaxID=569365 RepID=A0A0D1ZZI9_9EURO|nr:uncharacterized protein PV07_00367 [Cladophialophora immunda]KIW33526.1 hypothetical protein PV07_00367 [Cladophialophora immunda]OQV06718.1 hypothetical protein CLAIMM_11251 isoform 2 [Cladophialophora immunda]
MDSAQAFLDNADDLTDLELAVLLSLVAQHHCMLVARDDLLDDLASELALIVRDVFGLSYIILDRDDLQSIKAFGSAILDDDSNEFDDVSHESDVDVESSGIPHSKLASVNFGAGSSSVVDHRKLDTRSVVNVIIAKDFNLAPEDVQIQALELIRKRRIYSRTTVHLAPTVFLLLPLVATSSKHIRLNKHLNDRIFMSHTHSPEDGFPNLEELDDAAISEDHDSTYSYSRSPSARRQQMIASRRIDAKLIEQLRAQGQAATITPEIRRYLQDVVAFLRMERGVDGGISPYGTTLFLALAKYLAPFHGINYVTPSLVALAAKKIYPHRIIMATPGRERSTQYGTDLASARDILNDLDPDKVIQNVLDTVECPT